MFAAYFFTIICLGKLCVISFVLKMRRIVGKLKKQLLMSNLLIVVHTSFLLFQKGRFKILKTFFNTYSTSRF